MYVSKKTSLELFEEIQQFMEEEKKSIRQALSHFHKSPDWYYRWKKKIESGDKSDRRGWKEGKPRKLKADLSDRICSIRDHLENTGPFWDAEAVLSELKTQITEDLPSLSYVKKILQKRGKTHGRFSRRKTDERTYPTSLFPDEALRLGADFWGPKTIKGCDEKAVAVALSFFKAEKALSPAPNASTESLVRTMYDFLKKYQRIPVFCLSDNGSQMIGNTDYLRKFGRYIRLLLNLGIIPVFVPEGQPWRNGATESVNSVWKNKYWGKKTYASAQEVHTDMRTFSQAISKRHVDREQIPEIESHMAELAREKLSRDNLTHRSLTRHLHINALSTIVFIRPVYWNEEKQVAFFKMLGCPIRMDKKWIGFYIVAVVNVRTQRVSIWYEEEKDRLFTRIKEQAFPCSI